MEYSYKIMNIYCYPTYEGQENMVFNVQWIYSGTDGTYSSNLDGTTTIPFNPDIEYTPFDELTEEQVISWVEQNIDPALLSEIRAKIEADILGQSSPPPVINPILPWKK
jgi:hypothetical protein